MRNKMLCIYNEIVYEVSMTKLNETRTIQNAEYARQDVLLVSMLYTTKNKKPSELLNINFKRITFDEQGKYNIKEAHRSDEHRNELSYAFADLSAALGGLKPLPIPKAPTVPTKKEVKVITAHLNKKYPLLLLNSPYAIEESISIENMIYKEKIDKFKRSHKVSN